MQNLLVFQNGGQYLYIHALTEKQRLGTFHCEVINVFDSPAPVRAPTTYTLNGIIPSYTLTVYTPNEPIIAAINEVVWFAYAAAMLAPDGKNARVLSLACNALPKKVYVSVSFGLRLRIYLPPSHTGPLFFTCIILGTRQVPYPRMEVSIIVERKDRY